VVSVLQAAACHTDTTPTSHTETPTHIETRTHNQCGDTVEKSQAEACFSLQHGYHSNPTTPYLQHTSNQEQYDQCGNSTE